LIVVVEAHHYRPGFRGGEVPRKIRL